MRSYHFSKENLAKLNPYKVILKMSAAENEKKNRYIYNAVSNCP